MNCNEIHDLLHPLIDDELSVNDKSVVNEHLANCNDCQHEYASIQELRTKTSSLPRYCVPNTLADKISAQIANESYQDSATTLRSRFSKWGVPTLTHGVAALCGGLLIYMLISSTDTLLMQEEEILSAHVRSLMDENIIQIASADTHTVAPWFSGKVSFAPKVKDLNSQGFVLLGGRADYLENTKVAAIVYQRRKHVINLFITPQETNNNKSLIDQELIQWSRHGYNIVSWHDDDFSYAAISDLSSEELMKFGKLIVGL